METQTTGYWNITKEKLKQEFQILSDEDVQLIVGKEKEMIEMIGKKLGKTRDELIILKTWPPIISGTI